MKKILLFMLVFVGLFTFVACGESRKGENTPVNAEVTEEKTEEQVRIDDNNAVILPKLGEGEAIIVEIETVVNDNDLGEKYQSVIDQLREQLAAVTKNHQTIIDIGGYLEGTADFELAVARLIETDKEILDLILADLELIKIGNELVDKFNELADFVNEVTVNAQDNGWTENEELLSELGVAYEFMDEVNGKFDSSDDIEETYKNEKIEIIDKLLPVFQEYLKIVSVPFKG